MVIVTGEKSKEQRLNLITIGYCLDIQREKEIPPLLPSHEQVGNPADLGMGGPGDSPRESLCLNFYSSVWFEIEFSRATPSFSRALGETNLI